MSKRVSGVRNIKTIKAYRGEALTISLGKEFLGGVLTAWMKKDPNSDSYRSFEIIENKFIKLTSEKTSDYKDVSGNIIETVEGKWYFDVEFLPDGSTEHETVVSGTILFINDITNSSGYEVTDPNTGNSIIEIIKLTEGTNLDEMQSVGQFAFDVSTYNSSDYTYSDSDNETRDLSVFTSDLKGAVIRVFNKHDDNLDEQTHLVQEISGGELNLNIRRTLCGGVWSDWVRLGEDPKITTLENIDELTIPGTYFFDTQGGTVPSDISMTKNGDLTNLSTVINQLNGTCIRVFGKHDDTSDDAKHITQEVVEGVSGKTYRRQYNSIENEWSKFIELTGVEEAPVDGTQYVREDGAWMPLILPSGLEEAPADGVQYVRQNEGWQPLEAVGISIDQEIAEFIPGRKHFARGYFSESTLSVSLQGNSFGLPVGSSTSDSYMNSFHRRQQTSVLSVGANYGIRSFYSYCRMKDAFYFRFTGFFQNSINGTIYLGMDNSTGVHGSSEPSTILNTCFVGKDSTDTNLHIIHNGSTTGIATKIDLGSNFAMDVNRTVIVEMFSRYGEQVVYVRVTDPDSEDTSGWIEVSSNLPNLDRMLAVKGMCNRASDSTSVMLMQFKNISIHV